MDLDCEPNAIAAAASEQIRALNHLTLQSGAYLYPARVHDTALALRELAQRLPQALQQLQSGLDQLVASGEVQLYDDSGDTVLERQMNVAQALKVGAAAAAQLEGAMAAVARLTSGLGATHTAEGDDDQ